jgi:hypothetical protein
MKRILIGGIVGGIVVFVWGFVSHVVLPLGHTGLRSLPGEEPVLAALSASVTDAGLYFFPGMDLEHEQTPEEEAAWTERYRTGPTGLIVYRPVGGEPMSPVQLVTELVSGTLAALVAAAVLSLTAASYGKRVLAVASLGLFAWLALSVSYWNWYGFPTPFIAAEGIDQVVGWLLAGLVMARIVPPAARG